MVEDSRTAPPGAGDTSRVGARTLTGITLFWVPLALLTDGLTVLVLPAMLDQTGQAKPSTLGAITFVALLAAALTQLVAGAASDRVRWRFGRGDVMTVGVAVMVVALVLLGRATTIVTMAIAFVVVQIAVAIAQAAQQGLLPDQVPTPRRGFASGLKGFADVGGAAAGFFALGFLIEARGPTAAIATAGGVAVIALIGTRVLVKERRITHVGDGPIPSVRHIVRLDLRRDRAFLQAVAARFLFLLPTFAVGRILLFFVEDRVLPGVEDVAAEVGALLAVLALITGLVAPVSGWAADHFGRDRLMVLGCLVSAVGVAMLTTATGIAILFVAGALMSVGAGSFAAANWAAVVDRAVTGEGARYLALANLGTAGAAAAAGLLSPIIDRGGSGFGGGYAPLFSVCAALFVAAALLVVLPRPDRDVPISTHPSGI